MLGPQQTGSVGWSFIQGVCLQSVSSCPPRRNKGKEMQGSPPTTASFFFSYLVAEGETGGEGIKGEKKKSSILSLKD